MVSLAFLGLPTRLVTFPPASLTNNLPAVEPKLFEVLKLIMASILPLATQQVATEEDPAIRKPLILGNIRRINF